jgi:hypothetical protein
MFSAELLQAQMVREGAFFAQDRNGAVAVNQAAAGSSGNKAEGGYAPRPEWIPAWAEQGNFHFMRLDGGPIEPQKASRSAWGKTFTSADKEVLGNLYGKYAGRATDLISEASVNWVWITWSVGFSWQDEAAQREQAKQMVERLHKRGIHVTAYMCASSIFWQSMFRDQPQSVGWVKYDPNGIPYRYSSGKDPSRFMADVANPGWVALEEKRIGAAIDAGFDAVFLDNTSDPDLADASTMDGFLRELRRFAHEGKHSKILLLSNFGLDSERTALNVNMDVVFDEYYEEPGAWGNEWNVRNIRRHKYMRGVIPEWKPMITEYSQFRSGNRSTTYLSPRSERLSIAEAATFGGSFAHDMEGPFDDALIHGNKAAMASWNAIGVYNRFLARHRDIYHDATQVANYLVLLPGTGMSFDWREEKNDLYDVLAKKSVLFSLMLVGRVHEADLAKYKTVVIPKGVPWPDDLRNYKKRGGHVDVVDGAPKGTIGTMLKEPPACASLSIDSGRNVLGNITRIDAGKSLAIHILNYAATPDADVRIGVELGPDCENTIQGALQVFSPDAATSKEAALQRSGHRLSFALSRVDTYAVAVLR